MNENKQIARRYIEEIWSQGRLELVDELVAPDYRGQTRATGQNPAEGREALKRWVGGLHAAFPGGTRTIEELIAEGDRVVARFSAQGTHTGPWKQFAPAGKTIHYTGVTIAQIESGKIIRHHTWWDVLELVRQISGEDR